MSIRHLFVSAAAIAVSASLLIAPVAAQQAAPADPSKVDNVSKDAKKPAGLLPVKQLELAAALAQYGRAQKDPLSLIVAARMRQQVAFKTEDRKPDNADAAAIDKDDGKLSVEGLLKEAADLSGNDKTIMAMADDVKASAAKGRVGGGIISRGTITGNTTHNLTMSFSGGRFAEVAAAGTDNDDIVLEIYDQSGHLICRDSDPAYCSFNPIWTGPFLVKVRNNGSSGGHYRLETN